MANESKNKSETISLDILRKDMRIDIACVLYKEEKISLGKAVEIAGVNYEDMKRILYERGVKLKRGAETAEELDAGLKRLEKWREES